jgi:predicted DsbA family dithiol-disulfide isomerase
MHVEIWSDVVCPWCYIGKRRFEAALELFPHRDEVTVTYRSFELEPRASQSSDGTLNEHLARKIGVSVQQAARMNARVSSLAAEAGLDYHLDIARRGNTFNAHRLIHLGAAHGIQGSVKERLMRGYFTEGEPVGEAEALVKLAAAAGLDPNEARAVLESDAYAKDVRDDEHRAAEFGISAVPFFVLDEQYGVSGAQPTEFLLEALQTAWKATHPLTLITPKASAETSAASVIDADSVDHGDGACEGDSCDIES